MLADSHIHLFEGGYRNSGKPELDLYLGLRETFSIDIALAVGYEGEPWAEGNNSFLANLQETNSWLHAVAYIKPANLKIEVLESFQSQGFIGISLYIFDADDLVGLKKVSAEVWRWLEARKWIINVNSKAKLWLAWLPILGKSPNLSLLISHMGLPFDANRNTSESSVESRLQPIKQVCEFPNVYLKLSGFYALEVKKPAFPYPSLTPYFQHLVATIPSERIIWGSDFSAVLDHVDFAQTFENLLMLPFLTPEQISKILGFNLVQLLAPHS